MSAGALLGDAGTPNKLKLRETVRNTAFDVDDPLLFNKSKNSLSLLFCCVKL